MRVFLTVAVALLLVAARQDDDLEKRIQREIEQELTTLRKDLRDFVLKELRGGQKPGDVLGLSYIKEKRLEKALEILDEELLKEFVTYLSSDALEGRGTGTEGNNKAAAFIAKQFKKAGLKPVGDKDEDGEKTYYQHFKVRRLETQNVVGLLEGSDPDLKDQIIVVGGHHDHLGRARRPVDGDDIFNGADDNASGSCTVAALARAFGESGLRPRRSILFMTFSGEEMGLWGSRYYVRNPLFDKAKHAAMLNMDMVGRNADRPVTIMGTGSAKDNALDKISRAAIELTGLKSKIDKGSRLQFGDSDHSSFRNGKIPAMFFFTWLHPDYHKLTDHVDKIEFERMEKIGETAIYVLLGMANRQKDFEFKPEPGPRRLGVNTDNVDEETLDDLDLDDDQGAMEVERVYEDSAGATAGLKVGDLILSLNGQKIPRGRRGRRTLLAAIRQADGGKDIPVVIMREGKRKHLTVRWDE